MKISQVLRAECLDHSNHQKWYLCVFLVASARISLLEAEAL